MPAPAYHQPPSPSPTPFRFAYFVVLYVLSCQQVEGANNLNYKANSIKTLREKTFVMKAEQI